MAVLSKKSSPLGGTPTRVSPGLYRDPMGGGLIKAPGLSSQPNAPRPRFPPGISSQPNAPRPRTPPGIGMQPNALRSTPPPAPNLGLLSGGGEPGNSPTGTGVDWNQFGNVLGGSQGMPQQPIPYGNDGIAPKPIPYGNDGITPPMPKSPYDLSGDMIQPGGGAPIRPMPSTQREGQPPGSAPFPTSSIQPVASPTPNPTYAPQTSATGSAGGGSYGTPLSPLTRPDKFQKPQPKPSGGGTYTNAVIGKDKYGKPIYGPNAVKAPKGRR